MVESGAESPLTEHTKFRAITRSNIEKLGQWHRLDSDLRSILDEGTRFGSCSAWEPSGAEYPEEVACSWDA